MTCPCISCGFLFVFLFSLHRKCTTESALRLWLEAVHSQVLYVMYDYFQLLSDMCGLHCICPTLIHTEVLLNLHIFRMELSSNKVYVNSEFSLPETQKAHNDF